MPRREEPFELPLRGDLVTLRLLSVDDASAIYELASDMEVAKQTLSMTVPASEDDARLWILDELSSAGVRRQVLGIIVNETGAFIGSLSLSVRQRFRKRGIVGYWIGRPHWGNGYGREALELFLRYGDQVHGLSRFDARVFEDNLASQKVLEKNGFRLGRKKRVFAPDHGGWREVLTYRKG